MRLHLLSLLLLTTACSESALKSALYNPEDDDAPPATFVNQRPENESSGPAVGSGQRPTEDGKAGDGETSNPIGSIDVPLRNMPNRPSQRPQQGMMFSISDTSTLFKALAASNHMTYDFRKALDRAEVVEIRLEFQSVQAIPERQELELEGYLAIVLRTPDGLVHVRRLLNEGPILYQADGTRDLMTARFSIKRGVSLEISMTRVAARTLEKALQHPWQGHLVLREGENLVDLAEMNGFVSSL